MSILRQITYVCFTGPESVGKTTLARQIAALLGTEWVPETARAYAERVGRQLAATDAEQIAREHIANVEAARALMIARGASSLVLDTDLVSTVVYARHYYGAASDWLVNETRARVADLYFLCDVDVPWHADGIRDRPENRPAMLEAFRGELRALGADVVEVSGTGAVRLRLATAELGRRGWLLPR